MEEPDALSHVGIKAKNDTKGAFDEVKAEIKAWSASLKVDVENARKYIVGFREAVEFTKQAMGGFGAVGLARDLAGIASGAIEAAFGLGQFVLDAKDAGAVVDNETLRAASELRSEFGELKAAVLGLGVELAEPFITPLTNAADAIGKVARGARPMVEGIAAIATGAAEQTAKITGLTDAFNALWGIGSKFGELGAKAAQGLGDAMGDRSVSTGIALIGREGETDRALGRKSDIAKAKELRALTDADRREAEAIAKEAAMERERDQARQAREAQRRMDEDRRKQEAEDRETLREQTSHDQKLARIAEREKAEDDRRTLRAQEIMVEFDQNELDKMAQVDFWAQQQLAMVKGHEDAELAIRQEAERRKANLLQQYRDKEQKDRITAHVKNLQAQAAALNAAQGLAQAAGVKSHGLQKAMAIGQAIIQFNLAKAKAIGEGGPLAGPALVAAVIGMMTPIIGALRGSSPGGGSEFSGGFSAPALGSFGGGSPSISSPSPQAPNAPVIPQNKVEVALIFKGSLLTEEKISQGVMDAIEIASRDGRTSIVTRKD